MINCPKCQFNQPKDQFCANCGIDMDAYRPTPKPFAIRIVKNWIFQLGFSVVAIGAGIFLVRAKNRAQLSEGFAAFSQAASNRMLAQRNFLSKKSVSKKPVSSAEDLSQVSKNDLSLESSEATRPSPTSETGAGGAVPLSVTGNTVQAVKSLNETSEAATSAPSKLKLVFAEMSRSNFANLVGDSRAIASVGTYSSGLIPDRDDKSKTDLTGGSVVDSANDLQIKINQPIVVFKGSRDPLLEQNIGLTTQITPTFIDDQGVHLQVEVKRTMRNPASTGSPIIEETFQEQMILRKDAKAFMTGLLPHRILSEEEAHTLSTNPTILKVLASADFQSGNSEFVLFIEAK